MIRHKCHKSCITVIGQTNYWKMFKLYQETEKMLSTKHEKYIIVKKMPERNKNIEKIFKDEQLFSYSTTEYILIKFTLII